MNKEIFKCRFCDAENYTAESIIHREECPSFKTPAPKVTDEELNLHIAKMETIHGDEPIRIKITLPWAKELLVLRAQLIALRTRAESADRERDTAMEALMRYHQTPAASPGPIPADAATPRTEAENVSEIARLNEQCAILNSLREASICAQATSRCLTCSDLKQWGKTTAEPKYGEFKCLECGNSYCREHAKAHFTGSKMDRLGCQSFEIATEAIATLERELTAERAKSSALAHSFGAELTAIQSALIKSGITGHDDAAGYSIGDAVEELAALLTAERAARLKVESDIVRSVNYTSALLTDLDQLRAELSESNDFMAYMTQTLSGFECCCPKGAHDSTPPMMWPEYIACIVRKATQSARAELETISQRTMKGMDEAVKNMHAGKRSPAADLRYAKFAEELAQLRAELDTTKQQLDSLRKIIHS